MNLKLCPICLRSLEEIERDIMIMDGPTYFKCEQKHRFFRSPWDFEYLIDAEGVFAGVRKFKIDKGQ